MKKFIVMVENFDILSVDVRDCLAGYFKGREFIVEPIEMPKSTITTQGTVTAEELIGQCNSVLESRAQQRGVKRERSIPKVVDMFNILTGHKLTYTQGWLFMVFLKIVRSSYKEYDKDNYVDGINYIALAGEEESNK